MASTSSQEFAAEDRETVSMDAIRAAIARQGGVVRTIKKEGGDWSEALAELQALRKLLEEVAEAQGSSVGQALKIDRELLDAVLVRRMFVVPSFEIYGGTRGFYDFGPPGCRLKSHFVDTWRKHFVLEEGMLEIECTNLMPYDVLKTSGHVDRFTDLMVKDPECKEAPCARADKLLEEHIENLLTSSEGSNLSGDERLELEHIARQADAYSADEMEALFDRFDIRSPAGNKWGKPFPFNLMFKTMIGPEGTQVGFLRPETAQGIFINFERLYGYNAEKMPFAVAQVGSAFRNEIAPRAGLLRVREFGQMEIEHFVHPEDKRHDKFADVGDMKLTLFPSSRQLGDGKTVSDVTLRQAVDAGTINNESLAYFLARTHLFLVACGVHAEKLRFRQHLPTELSHYATDCWDAEILTSYGWVECVGHADRACYDLGVHADATKRSMVAKRRFPGGPRKVQMVQMKANKGRIGKQFRADAKSIMQALEGLSDEEALALEAKLQDAGSAELGIGDNNNQTVQLARDMVSWKQVEKMVHEETFRPSVIEPSFGIGRILYAIMEHAFYTREEEEEAQNAAEDKGKEKDADKKAKKKDKKKKKDKSKKNNKKKGEVERTVFRFRPIIAPIKCAVLPLSNHDSFKGAVNALSKALTDAGLESRVDSSSAPIGRRYARMDEIGVPFGLTVDFTTVGFECTADNCVTLRERDTMQQTRVPIADVVALLHDLVAERTTFANVAQKYGLVGEGASLPLFACHGTESNTVPVSSAVQCKSEHPDGKRFCFARPN